MRRIALALLALAVGCGGSEAVPSASKPSPPKTCGPTASFGLVVCGYGIARPNSRRPSTIWARAKGRLERIAGPAEVMMNGVPPRPVKNAYPAGFWVPDRLYRSPDGRTLLAQWSGACETQTAYLVSVATGKVRAVFASKARGISMTYESTTHGWTADGLARVRLPYPFVEQHPRVQVRAGMYDVDPVTLKRTLERRLPYGPHC